MVKLGDESGKERLNGKERVNVRVGRSILARLVLSALALMIAVGLLLAFFLFSPTSARGITYGLPPRVPANGALGWLGVNVDWAGLSEAELDQKLEMVKRAGLSWVRQRFRWADIESQAGRFDWSAYDALVSACRRHGVALVPVLDTSPSWARKPEEATNPFAPPAVVSHFGAFAAALATRYGDDLQFYQIWDEPNIAPHWGSGPADPSGYMRLLREANIQIRAVDPDARIVTAGFAPTTESGPMNMNEALFLQGLYAAGGARYFDAVAAKPYGFWSGPDDRRIDAGVLNFSRVVIMREIMVDNGDAAKPLWAVEMGWNALPANWSGRASPWGADAEELQTMRTVEALNRARVEWPWMNAVALARFEPTDDPADPANGFALIDSTGQPRALFAAIERLSSGERIAYPGQHAPNDPAIQYIGGWRVFAEAADPGGAGDSAELAFYGTRIDLTIRRGRYWGVVYATVDGEPANRLPQDEKGRSYLVLYDPLEREATVPVAAGLPEGIHRLRLSADGGWQQWPILEFVVVREQKSWPYSPLGFFVAACLGFGGVVGLVLHLRLIPWQHAWRQVELGFGSLGEVPQVSMLGVFCLAFYFLPVVWARLIILVFLSGFICLRPQLGVAVVTFAVPLVLQVRQLPGRSINILELSLLVTLAAFFLHFFLDRVTRVDVHERETPLRGFVPLDYAMLVLVGASMISLFTAQNFGVANREFRVVILEPVLFYFLLRVIRFQRRDLWLLTDALIVSALVVACIGLFQYGFTSDIISAEGVRRVKALYSSPNNLSLFLGRVVALLMGLVLAMPMSRRRVVYMVALIPTGICLYLTFSRGAWLFGLPLAILFLAIMKRGKALWGAAAALGLMLVTLVPAASTERIANLFSIEGGTGALRLKLWQGTLNMIREHPLFGVGLDNFLYQYRTRYILPDAWQEPNLSHPHNFVLDYWTRLGLLGLVTLVVQVWAYFRTGLKAYWALPAGPERALVLGLLAQMVYALAHGLIDNSFFLIDLALLFAWASGLLVSLSTYEARSGFHT